MSAVIPISGVPSVLNSNPYCGLEDGLYKTRVDDYLEFCSSVDWDVGDGKLLYSRCSNGLTDIYVVKRDDFYAFFSGMYV